MKQSKTINWNWNWYWKIVGFYDGFVTVTEKVWESDSTDASDVETEDKQNVPENEPQSNQALSAAFQNVDSKATKQKKNKSTTAANKQVKQSSLMSFFKKTWVSFFPCWRRWPAIVL